MFNHNQQIGGKPVYIRDCYIWAEIHYLDSATDYREYLLEYPVRRGTVRREDLVMLDSSRQGLSSNPQRSWAIAALFLFITGVILCLLMW
jgi:hypothetical protein